MNHKNNDLNSTDTVMLFLEVVRNSYAGLNKLIYSAIVVTFKTTTLI